MNNTIVVALNCNRLTIPQIIERSRIITTSMTGNANFLTPNPTPLPTLASIITDTNALETAHVAADNGGRTLKAIMRSKRAIVLRDLISLRGYVQTIVNLNPANGEAIALSAGMGIKTFNNAAVHEFTVKNTVNPGEIKLVTPSAGDRGAYTWQMCTDPSAEANWHTVGQGTRASFTVNGLTSGTRYYFRVAFVDRNGLKPWSNVLNSIVL